MEWDSKIKMMDRGASGIHLVMNTNYHDQWIISAGLLGEVLSKGL